MYWPIKRDYLDEQIKESNNLIKRYRVYHPRKSNKREGWKCGITIFNVEKNLSLQLEEITTFHIQNVDDYYKHSNYIKNLELRR